MSDVRSYTTTAIKQRALYNANMFPQEGLAYGHVNKALLSVLN